jgi:hypothetical protein
VPAAELIRASGISIHAEEMRMDDQLASAMAAVAFAAVLLVTALFHIDRIHTPSYVDKPSTQMAAQR